jgi:CheY-like chemotaxis protein
MQIVERDQATCLIPIILFTRFDDRETTRFGFLAGAVEYIPKDAFADAVLMETLREKGLVVETEA